MKKKNKWEEKDNIMYLELTSTKITGLEWLDKIRQSQDTVDEDLANMLLSNDFVPTQKTYKVAILRSRFYPDEYGWTSPEYTQAFAEKEMGFVEPSHEVGLLAFTYFNAQDLHTIGLKQLRCPAEGTEIPYKHYGKMGMYPCISLLPNYQYTVYSFLAQKLGFDEDNEYLFLVPEK